MLGAAEMPLTLVLWLIVLGAVAKLIGSVLEIYYEVQEQRTKERWEKIVRGDRS